MTMLELDQPDAPGSDFERLQMEAVALDQAAAPPTPEGQPDNVAARAQAVQFLKSVCQTAGNVLAPAWNIADKEYQELATAYADLLLKHFPGGLGSMGPELAAISVTCMIIGPRLAKPRHDEEPPPAIADTPKT